MNIETFDRDDHQKKVVAEFDAETLERYKHQAARRISQEVKIPGFRPGKAPYDMVRRIYGDDAILEQAMSLLVDEVYPQILQEAKINPGGPGKMEEIISQDPPKFSFIIPLAPEVELGDYKAIREEYIPPTVGEDKVDEVITRLLKRSATAELVDRPSNQGDLVSFKLAAHLTNPAEGQEPLLFEENSYQMIAGEPEDYTDSQGHEWPFPGFSKELIGLSAGEKKVSTYTFPEEEGDELNGKVGEFTVEVENVKSLTLPEANDEFAQSMGDFENLVAFRADILKQLLENESQTYNRTYFDGIIQKLIDGAKIKYAPSALEEEINHVISHFTEDLSRQKMDLETYLKTRDLTREAFIEQEVKQVAQRNLARDLALEEFAFQEKIQIKPEEVQMVYDLSVSQAKSDENLKNLAKGNMNTKQVADSLARSTINEIFNQRLINRLRDIAVGKADGPEAEAVAEPQISDETKAEEPGDTPPTAESPAVSE